MEYNSLSKAKYTYWHSIIEIAKESGLPKEEWCRKNCISIKTFNHFQGIFDRQDQRAALKSTDDIGYDISESGMICKSDGQMVSSPVDIRDGKQAAFKKEVDNKVAVKVIPGTPFVEIPFMSDVECSDADDGRKEFFESIDNIHRNDGLSLKKSSNITDRRIDNAQEKSSDIVQDIADSSDRPTVVIRYGKLEMTFYGHVDEGSMIAVMKAVMCNA